MAEPRPEPRALETTPLLSPPRDAELEPEPEQRSGAKSRGVFHALFTAFVVCMRDRCFGGVDYTVDV